MQKNLICLLMLLTATACVATPQYPHIFLSKPSSTPNNLAGSITDVPDIEIGHATYAARPTGCTVILSKKGSIAGVDIRGGAAGTRETALLDPTNAARKINAIVLAGGSAYGLAAASGTATWLKEHAYGYDTTFGKVALVPAAILYDLPLGDYPNNPLTPDEHCGYHAAVVARAGAVQEGNIGAGRGATVGKLFGATRNRAVKSGIGTASIKLDNGLIIGAIVAVNALGDVIDPNTNNVIAGVRSEDGQTLLDARTLVHHTSSDEPLITQTSDNTTIGVVATNAHLSTIAEATKLAQMAQSGYVRTIAPIHTPADGDTVFALSTGEWQPSNNETMNMVILGELAAQVMAKAILRAVCLADELDGFPAPRDFGGCESILE